MPRGRPLLRLVTRGHPTREEMGVRARGREGGSGFAFRGKLLIFYHLPFEYTPSVGHVERVQHVGSQTRAGSGIPMVPVRVEETD